MVDDLSQWWKNWWKEDYSWEGWKEDYSWEGLAQKPWQGWCVLPDGQVVEDPSSWPIGSPNHGPQPLNARSATLQDYWRDQEQSLIVCPATGKQFTALHLPLHWENGVVVQAPDERQLVNIQYELIQSRISRSSRNMFTERQSIGPDGRSIFDGAVIREFSLAKIQSQRDKRGHSGLCISAKNCMFNGDANFMGASFLSYVTFEGFLFFAAVCFDQVKFEYRAEFEGVKFFASASFSGSEFASSASFPRAHFYADAAFFQAKMSKIANFQSCCFRRASDFTGCQFKEAAIFQDSVFMGPARIHNVVFGGGGGWFQNASFFCDANFIGSIFEGEAAFERSLFVGLARFNSAQFSRGLRFSAAILFEGINCEYISIRGDLNLRSFISIGNVNFDGSPENKLHKDNSDAPDVNSVKRIDATDALFLSNAFFENRTIQESSSFRGCAFFGRVSFHGASVHQGVSFHNAHFDGSLLGLALRREPIDVLGLENIQEVTKDYFKCIERQLRKSGMHLAWESEKWNAYSGQVLERLKAAFVEDAETDLNTKIGFGYRPESIISVRDSDYFVDLEDAFRTLRLSMEHSRNRAEEFRFFRLELLARRKRRDAGVPLWEKVLSVLYQNVADFGNSVLLPAIWLIVMTVLLAAVYTLFATWPVQQLSSADWAQGFSFSLGRVLPFGPWAEEPEACSDLGRLLAVTAEGACTVQSKGDVLSPLKAVAIRLLGSLQSFAALILFFLIALAARRRFQIS